MNKVKIFTDGACKGNPGMGGWGALLKFGKEEKEINGYKSLTTNNVMELMAVIEALKIIHNPSKIEITTDSKYVKNGITNWIFNWKENNWKTSSKKPVKNKELWERLDELNLSKNINWSWVKAHNVDEFNNQVDILARKAAENLTDSSFN